MAKGGILKITASQRTVSPLENKEGRAIVFPQDLNYVLIEVSDTGSGIEPRDLKKIFNPFFTTKPAGLGLGLSICSRLVEENKGKIDVVSHKGRGTTFILALPTFMIH
jgi:signal transduction histidine kinase